MDMFLEPYRLEENPFAADYLRPFHRSLSAEYAAAKIENLMSGKLQHLFLSGPAGIGKSALIEREVNASDQVSVCHVRSGAKDTAAVLQHLLQEIGPGSVSGTPAELRNILHVFLRHQAARGQRTLIVVDGLERDALEVVKEIEQLVQLRLRGIPVVHLLLATRNEELVNQFRTRNETGALIKSHHQRLTGFTLDETDAYVRSVLKGAGCEWSEELLPKELTLEIQAFTQGIVGHIDALCDRSLRILAGRSNGSIRQQGLELGMLKEAAGKLNLRYDPAAWKIHHEEEVLSPSAVKLSRRDALRIEQATLSVSSGGKLVAQVTLNRPRMVLGRDRNCDISLESSYVSRYQNLFMETPDGWMLIDLNSTNGCFVNGRRVTEHKLRDGDLITLGQHHIRYSGQTNAEPVPDGSPSMTITRQTRMTN